jgi:anaerobic selenocysteine-containing dehydrogenase/NADPH-dependent glutamate synthase beta subunit-like oxidoreductase
MQAHTICLRCHQKCHLIAEVVRGRVAAVVDAAPVNRMPACREACPIGMDVPGYVIAASQGKFEKAMEIIRDTNPFPMVCGSICHHPCERECIRGVVDEPIAIMSVKRLVADYARRSGWKPSPVSRSREETVAIIGAGPSGLTAAHDLVKAGFGVTVFEASSEAGGMLIRVIPEFKLPKASVRADVEYLKALGVNIKTNTSIGQHVTIESLLKAHDAVLIAIGSWKPKTLEVPGCDLQGVHYALTLLEDVKEGKRISMNGPVVVIGGGNTAMDVARAAVRLGAKEVHLACVESLKSMPADPWEYDQAIREGVKIHPSLAPEKFRGDGHRRIAGVDFRRVAACRIGDDGDLALTLQEGPGSEASLPAETVIIAIGQTPILSSLQAPSRLELTPRGTLAVDSETMACNITGLFAAGDTVVGAGTVVESMAGGRRAAASIIEYLTGSRPKAKEPSLDETLARAKETVNIDFPPKRARYDLQTVSREEAISSFREVQMGYDEGNGMKEAARCLNCATVCIKGATIPEVMYHVDRLLYPLKRTGARGEGRWQRISWDEALDTIARELKGIKEKYGPEAIHVSCGSGQKHISIQAAKIAEKLWPTPNTHMGRYTCIHPDVMANTVTFGDSVTYEFGPDYGEAKCILFWGSDPDVGTPAQARVIHRALGSGSKLIVIDPRPIPMAKRAHLWLRIRPGTDMALGLAMANVIINHRLYDKEFVEKYCSGFEPLCDHVQKYTPAWAAAVTGLPEGDIVAAARMYAGNRPGCIYVRLGSGAQQVTSTQTCRAISILIGITGNVDAKGGNLLYHRTFQEALMWHPYIMFSGVKPPAAVNEKRFGAREYPLMHKAAFCHIPTTIKAMEEGKVRALWAIANNLIVAEMDNRRIWDILKNKLDFIFVSELFMTPTAELADIVLPAAFYTECDQLVEAFGHPSSTVSARERIVEPAGECRDDREVAIEIGRRMGMDVSPWDTLHDYLNWMLKYQGMSYDDLLKKPNATLSLPRNYERYRASTPPFNTPTGKVELHSKIFEAMGLDPMPVFQEPPESPIRTPELFKKFPFIYTHYRTHGYMHSEGRQIKRQRELTPEPYLQINSKKAADLGIESGDWVYLETPKSAGKGRVKFRAQLIEEMHPDVVAGPHAWWFPEKAGPQYGCFDSNINALVTLDPPFDPVVGVPQVRAILCRVWKADSESGEKDAR